MSLGSRLNIESKGIFASFIFYIVVGIAFLVSLPLTGFPPHVGIIGISSLIAAYGIFKKRSWAIWIVLMLFFVATAFSAYMLYGYYLLGDYLLGIGAIVYLVLTWVFSAYATSRRKTFES